MSKHDDDAPEERKYNETKPDLSDDFVKHVKALSKRAEETEATNKQLKLGIPDEEPVTAPESVSENDLADTQDPDEAHRLFWAVQNDLMAGLPKGEEHKELRDIVYEEKNDYLNRGKLKDTSGRRGSDSRASYLTHLRRAVRIVRRWRREGGSAFDIWSEFRALNEEAGYKKKREAPLKIQGTLDDVLRVAVRDDKPKGK